MQDDEPPGADTATISQNLELYGGAPSRDEPDSRIVWDEDHSLAGLGEAMRIIVQGITVEGTQMADEREPIMWGFVNVLHSQVQRLDRAVDRIAPEIRELQAAQDGTEINANELELATDRARNLGDRRDAFEKMRDLAAEAYRAETANHWRPRHGSHISRGNTDTQPRIDARDYRNARKQKQLHPQLYAGTVIALAGGKDVPHPDAVRNELDLQLSSHPDMVLAHGGAPGVEKIGSQWAEAKGVKQIVLLPNWKLHENAAPFRRNEEIIKLQPKVLIAFPGSGITKNLIDKARQAGIPITTGSLTPTRRPSQDHQPTIFNLNDHPDAVKNGAIRIDRETEWGNPFKIGEDGSREEVIARYTKDLWKRIRSGNVSIDALARLNGKDLACTANDCHGDVLASAASWAAGRLEQKAAQEMTADSANQARQRSTQTAAQAGDRSQTAPSPTTPDASETPSTSETASTKTRTRGTPDNAASEPHTTVTDEPDSRIAWDRDDALAALRQAMHVIVEDITIEGTQMADEREPLLWGFANMLHAQVQRIERTMNQGGKELEDRRNALKEMRDMAADAYLAEAGRPWQPRQPSHTSQAATITQAARDAQNYLDAVKKQKIDDHLPQGTIIALSGGKTVTDPNAVWNELDRALARKPDMILLHGNAPGVEKIGARWAESRDITQIVCLPNWKLHDKAAPFRRNQEIINLRPAELIAFPGSGITDNLVDKATQAGIPVVNASLSATISADKPSQQQDPHQKPIILDLKQNPDAVKAGAIRIDRETRWANPFQIGQHGTREQVTSLYTKDLWKQIRSGHLPLPDLAALDGKTLACATGDCHGQVLASAATWAAGHLAKQTSEGIPVTSADPARQHPISADSTATDRSLAAPSADTSEASHAPTLAPASQQSTNQTQGPTEMHASDSFSASLQQFMEDYKARAREQEQTGIDRVLIPGLDQLSTTARTLIQDSSAQDLPTDQRLALQITLEDRERYDHAVTATDDICKRLDSSLSTFRHLEHLATIRAVDVSKIDSYDQWLAGAEKLSAEAENMTQDHEVYDCGFTPAKWQEFTTKLLRLDTALGDHESIFLRCGPLYLEPLPHTLNTSEDALKAHASYRQIRETWHEYIVSDGQYQAHPYEDVSPRIINTMRQLSDSTQLPDNAKQAMSTIVADYTAYRDAYSDVETYLQDVQHSLDTNRALTSTIEQADLKRLHAEDINGYSDWQDQTTKLVDTGERALSKDSTTFAFYLRHNPDLAEQLKSAVTNLKQTLDDPLPSRAQEIAQRQQMDQHRSVSRGMSM